MKEGVLQRFLTNTDETGRFIVKSFRTGKTYCVEPIGYVKTNFGSIDPATGNLMNKKGHDKYRGSIDPEDSLITEDNGFKNIIMLEPGTSPFNAIDVIDAKYPTIA
jgi:hypothetical protein